MPATKCLLFVEQGQKGNLNVTYQTGTDADVDTAIAAIISNKGYFTDLNLSKTRYVTQANVAQGPNFALDSQGRFASGIILNGPTTSWGAASPAVSTSLDPGNCALNILRVASAVKHGENFIIGAGNTLFDKYTISTSTPPSGVGILIDLSTGAATAASGVLTSTANYGNNETVTINLTTYTFKTVLTGAANEIFIGANEAASIVNLTAAINLTAGAGTLYGLPTVINPDVTAVAAAHTLTVTSKIKGTAPNSYASTKVAANATWGAATLAGGVDPSAANLTTALPAVVKTNQTLDYTLEVISANEVLFEMQDAGASALPVSTTMAGANNVWAATKFYGGRAAKPKRNASHTRVPNATEITLGDIHFYFDFTPVVVLPRVIASTGIVKAWGGVFSIVGNRVTLTNNGTVDIAATDTIYLSVTD